MEDTSSDFLLLSGKPHFRQETQGGFTTGTNPVPEASGMGVSGHASATPPKKMSPVPELKFNFFMFLPFSPSILVKFLGFFNLAVKMVFQSVQIFLRL